MRFGWTNGGIRKCKGRIVATRVGWRNHVYAVPSENAS